MSPDCPKLYLFDQVAINDLIDNYDETIIHGFGVLGILLKKNEELYSYV